jgi:hypothetical protein
MRWALVSALIAACGPAPIVCPTGADRATTYQVDSVTLPMKSDDFAYDLNGDGHTDNRFGNIVGALIQNSFDAQAAVDRALADGSLAPLVRIVDGGRPTDAAIVVVSDPQPDLSSGEFCVSTSGGRYQSARPLDMKGASTLTMHLPLVGNMPSTAVHITFQKTGAGLVAGQLNVAIKTIDVQTSLTAAMGSLLTAALQQSPGMICSENGLFDNGGLDDGSGCRLTARACANAQPAGSPGCRNPSFAPDKSATSSGPGNCADQYDGIVDTCELTTNSLFENLIATDVQLFDANGNWAPSPVNKNKDSLSFGFGFTAHAQ